MIIFSLDGTLAHCEHRRHFVEKPERCDCPYRCCICKKCEQVNNWKPDWQAYYENCGQDRPIEPIAVLFEKLVYSALSTPIEIWSGRCESVREKTIDWLIYHFYWSTANRSHIGHTLKMRPIGDNTPDEQLKERWLDELIKNDPNTYDIAGYSPENRPYPVDFVFESDPVSIAMWRRRGIFVFDVNQNEREI